jgi:hypothetical protein
MCDVHQFESAKGGGFNEVERLLANEFSRPCATPSARQR